MNEWSWGVPFITAFVGWFSIWITIKILFHPKEPRIILGFTFQGIFPRRKQEYAQKLADIIKADFLDFRDIEGKITSRENLQKIMPQVEQHIDHFLRVKLPQAMPMVGAFIGDRTITQLKTVFVDELEMLFPSIMKNYLEKLKNDADVRTLIMNKIAALSAEKIDDFFYKNRRKEMRFVEILGTFAGFLIGWLLLLLFLLAK